MNDTTEVEASDSLPPYQSIAHMAAMMGRSEQLPMPIQAALAYHSQCVGQMGTFCMTGNQMTGQLQAQQAELLPCQQQALLFSCRLIGKYFALKLRELGE